MYNDKYFTKNSYIVFYRHQQLIQSFELYIVSSQNAFIFDKFNFSSCIRRVDICRTIRKEKDDCFQHFLYFSRWFLAFQNINLMIQVKTVSCKWSEFWISLRLECARPGGSVVIVSDALLGGCEFDLRSRRTFFPARFRLSPLQKHARKSSRWLWLRKYWCEKARKHVRHRPP